MLVRHFLCQILLCTNTVLQIDPLIGITFLSKKYIFLDPFLCNFMRPKTSDKLSVNIDHV